MNVPTIKLLCWLSSATLTFGIAAYAWDFRKNFPQIRQPFDKTHLKQVLDENVDVQLDVKDGISYDEVREQMIRLNWTGKADPKPVVEEVKPTEPEKPKYRPVKELVQVLTILLDVDDPGGSRVFVNFRDPAMGVPDGNLAVGDKLPKPHDSVLVHQIRIEGIEFAFTDDGRENEILVPGDDGTEPLIFKVGEGNVKVPVRRTLPKAVPRKDERLAETRKIGRNTWELGTEDMEDFGENYAEILTRDVKTRVHFDEKGKRSGIEITEVRSGSSASRHGVQSGDVLISINGEPVKSEQEAIRYVKNNSDRYSVWEVEILRMGRHETHVYRSPDE
ncbi:MAG: PDZ domain-containing protein [bacterium]|nr:PDZ domain-containing protein [bacterium]